MMALAFVLIYTLVRQKEKVKLNAYAKAVLLWTMMLFIITEGLSVPALLTRKVLLLVWYGMDVLLIGGIIIKGPLRFRFYPRCKKRCFVPAGRNDVLLSILFFAVIGVAVCGALITVPYNYDSMTYHLSRVAHWAQNASVAHYATNIVRQVASPVLAEFMILNSYILCGNKDIFANMPQCLCFLSTGMFVYGTTKKLGGGNFVAKIASLLFFTTPIAFAESVTTQTDNVSALYMIIFVYMAIDFVVQESTSIQEDRKLAIWLGLCVAFGYLSKPSVCIAMLLIVFWVLIVLLAKKRRIFYLIRLALSAVPTLILPLSVEWARMYSTFGSFTAPIAGKRQLIGTLSPAYIFVNFCKNLAFNLPNVFFYDSQKHLTSMVMSIANFLSVDIDDPAIAEDGVAFVIHAARNYHMDTAVNPTLTLLSIFALVWLLCNIRKQGITNAQTSFSLVAICCFYVFCAILRYEPYVSRYMIPYFAIVAVAVAIQLESLKKSNKSWIYYSILPVAVFCCLTDWDGQVQTIANRKQDSNRIAAYFNGEDNEYKIYYEAASYINANELQSVGFLSDENDYEYPFIQMLGDSVKEYKHIDVQNETKMYEDTEFAPECIFSVGRIDEDGETYIYHDTIYRLADGFDTSSGYYLLIQQEN